MCFNACKVVLILLFTFFSGTTVNGQTGSTSQNKPNLILLCVIFSKACAAYSKPLHTSGSLIVLFIYNVGNNTGHTPSANCHLVKDIDNGTRLEISV